MTLRHRSRATTRVLCVGIVAVVLAACGSDSDSSSTSAASATTVGATVSNEPPSTEASTDTQATTGTDAPDTTSASTEPATDPNATLRIALPQAPTTWDPATTANGAIFMFFARTIYDSLLRDVNTPTGTAFEPSLATEWTVAPDGLSVEFKLRTDVKFQDGTAFDAAAVKANIERGQTLENSTAAARLANVTSVEVVDPATVKFTLDKADTSFLYMLADDPAGLMVSPAAFGSDLETKPVGSGPYTLGAVEAGSTTYQKFADYWAVDEVKAATVVVQTITDSNAALNSLQTGLVDLVRMNPLDYTKGQQLADSGEYQLALSYNSQPYMLMLNNAHEPFDDPTVRQAVSLALDRKSISEAVLPLNNPTAQIYQSGFIGHDEALDASTPYDVAEATSLVNTAGAQGGDIQILYPTIDPFPALAQIVQASLQAVGLNSTLVAKPPAETSGLWLAGDYDLFVGTWSGSPSPQTLASIVLEQTNVGKGVDEEANALVAAAAALDQSSPEAEAAWQALGAHLFENPMTVPVLRSAAGWLGSSKVVGLGNLQQPSGSLDLSAVGMAA